MVAGFVLKSMGTLAGPVDAGLSDPGISVFGTNSPSRFTGSARRWDQGSRPEACGSPAWKHRSDLMPRPAGGSPTRARRDASTVPGVVGRHRNFNWRGSQSEILGSRQTRRSRLESKEAPMKPTSLLLPCLIGPAAIHSTNAQITNGGFETPDSRHQKMEPMAGIEPATDGLRNRCSTAELHWRCSSKGSNFPPHTPFVMRNTLSLCYHPRKHKRFYYHSGFNRTPCPGASRNVFAFKWRQGAAIGRNMLHAAWRFAELWRARM